MRKELLFLACAAMVMCEGQPKIAQVVNAASYAELIAPGCWIAIFGSNLAIATSSAQTLPLPRTLGGVTVAVDGQQAPLLYVSANQINALIPFEVAAGDNRLVPVVVTNSAGTDSYGAYMNRRAPAIFTRDSSGGGLAHTFNGNFRTVDTVHPDDFIIFYATGLGPTNPAATTDVGGTASEPLNRVVDDVEVFVGDQKAQVLFAGLAPGFPGIYQVNIYVPRLWTDRLYVRESGWLSNIVRVGAPPGNNVARVSLAEFDDVFPKYVSYSLPFIGAHFRLQIDLNPNAKSFPISVVGEAGGWFTQVDLDNGMTESFFTTPTAASVNGDFSGSASQRPLVTDFVSGCSPMPNSVIPGARLDLAELAFMKLNLPPPAVTLPHMTTGMGETHAAYPAGTAGFVLTGAFGDFLPLPCGHQKTKSTTYSIYIDGRAVTSRTAAIPIIGR